MYGFLFLRTSNKCEWVAEMRAASVKLLYLGRGLVIEYWVRALTSAYHRIKQGYVVPVSSTTLLLTCPSHFLAEYLLANTVTVPFNPRLLVPSLFRRLPCCSRRSMHSVTSSSLPCLYRRVARFFAMCSSGLRVQHGLTSNIDKG